MSDRYTHRNGEPEPPTEWGCYEFYGRVKGAGFFAPYPAFFFVGSEEGPQYDEMAKRCVGKWYGPVEPPFKPCPPKQLTLLEKNDDPT